LCEEEEAKKYIMFSLENKMFEFDVGLIVVVVVNREVALRSYLDGRTRFIPFSSS
jgi:hypothetical protein